MCCKNGVTPPGGMPLTRNSNGAANSKSVQFFHFVHACLQLISIVQWCCVCVCVCVLLLTEMMAVLLQCEFRTHCRSQITVVTSLITVNMAYVAHLAGIV